jgi:hypothetical protein
MIFKNKHSSKAFFTFDGNTKRCIDSLYETDDKEEIKFLENNSNFEIFKVSDPIVIETPVLPEVEIISELPLISSKDSTTPETDKFLESMRG